MLGIGFDIWDIAMWFMLSVSHGGFTPSLKFNDRRNSQYFLVIF